MKPVKIWQKASILGEVRLGLIYISSNLSLKTDKEMKTLWLDLESKNFNKKKLGGLNFTISRNNSGSNQDFTLLLNSKIKNILNVLFKNLSNKSPISNLIDLILNPDSIQQENENFKNFILEQTKNFSQKDKNDLIELKNLILKTSKEDINKLLTHEKYSLLLGNLVQDDLIANKVGTETIIFDKHNITEEIYNHYFDKIILDDDIKQETFVKMNLKAICNGEMPKSGGVILVDHGGTGKSMMKTALKNFWEKELGGEVKEKSQADITSYVNAAFQLIQVWYRGGVMPSNENPAPEVDLVAAARKNKVPSLLIIDEAEDFIIEDKGIQGKKPIGGATGALKRFIQDFSKGGVTGYVVTILIANVDEKDIHDPLRQGGERLKVIHYGPPKRKKEWLQIIDIALKNLNLENNFNKEILANLLLFHNSSVSHEKFTISPRMFIAFCDDYYSLYSQDEDTSNENSFERFDSYSQDKYDINFKVFLDNLIKSQLINNLNKDENTSNKDEIIKKYYEIENLDLENNEVVIEDLKMEEINPEKSEIKLIQPPSENLGNYFKVLEEGINILNKFDRENQDKKNLDSSEIKQLVYINKTLDVLKNNISKYFKDIENVENLISFSLIKLDQLERDKYLTSTDYTNLIRNFDSLIENQK